MDAIIPNVGGTHSASWEEYNPEDFVNSEKCACAAATMLEELCKRIQQCCATRDKKCWELVAQEFDRFQTLCNIT